MNVWIVCHKNGTQADEQKPVIQKQKNINPKKMAFVENGKIIFSCY